MNRLFCYYGDDFTGSTDVLEVLAGNGVPTVLFLGMPTERRLAGFSECRAIGIAGESRSRGTEWMSGRLPAIFESLKRYGAPICQYKICSTFDSSPETGSIGRALEIGRRVFETSWAPIAVAAPHLGRYVLFGNLFAAAGDEVFRIDRHPTMRRHPVTPMDESDLRLHLARQTHCSILLLDILSLGGGQAARKLDELIAHHPDAILFDGLDASSQLETGRLLWTKRPDGQTFAIGSSGLTEALIHYWRASGLIPAQVASSPPAPVDCVIVVSGSCSPVTENQIRRSMRDGFDTLRFSASDQDYDTILSAGLDALSRGRSLVLYSALGPGDCHGALRGEELGQSLGLVLRNLLIRSGVRRAVVAGGDTASHAAKQLGVHALSFSASLTPGAPLCRAHCDDPSMDGLELVLKGGQVGPENFFETVRKGAA
jgi:3-oxoisoapionate kinase